MSSALVGSCPNTGFHPPIDPNAKAMTDIRWPNNPFHEGEIALQQAMNVQEHVMSYAPQFVRSYMPEQHRAFYTDLPFLVVAARDHDDNLWATLLEPSNSNNNNENFVTSPSPQQLVIHAQPVPGDALAASFLDESSEKTLDMGILGIQFETKRRNRVNGRVLSRMDQTLVFQVDQAFGNCPQYIQPRSEWYQAEPKPRSPIKSTELSQDQIQTIESAQTMFTATGYRGQGGDVRFGNDASHRGGPAGFVNVQNGNIVWTEFKGNNHYNSLGNLLLDPRMGVSFPDFVRGGLLQVSGTASLSKETGEGIVVTLCVSAVNQLPTGSLPIRFRTNGDQKRELEIANIVQESDTVKSFYLQPTSELPLLEFQAGQYLPVELQLDNGESLERTYSLSLPPSSVKQDGRYRISVKREEHGTASRYLHDVLRVGDTIKATKPAGEFVLGDDTAAGKNGPIVLLSNGIGVTPVLSMLGELSNAHSKRDIHWIHGARDGNRHVMRREVGQYMAALPNGTSHVFYSRPRSADTAVFHHAGRIDAARIGQIVKEPTHAMYYICGAPSFVTEMTTGLEAMGVNADRIQSESF